MPKASWKYSADWVALPAAHTTASQPVTGNGSWLMSWSTSPTRVSGLSRSEVAVMGSSAAEKRSRSSFIRTYWCVSMQLTHLLLVRCAILRRKYANLIGRLLRRHACGLAPGPPRRAEWQDDPVMAR